MTTTWETIERAWLLIMAASEEGHRCGHGQVDTDHVLLGLLTTGGPSAEALRAAGLGLDAARTAMAQLARDDLAGIGIEDLGWMPKPPDRFTGEVLPFTERAHQAVRLISRHEPDTTVLTAVLADPHGPAARLLQRAGVDPASLTSNPSSAPGSGTGRQWTAEAEHLAPVPIDRLWSLLDDPMRRAEWDHDVAQIRMVDADTFHAMSTVSVEQPRLSRLLGLTGRQITFRTTERVVGTTLAWDITITPGRSWLSPRGPHRERLRIDLAPDGSEATRIKLASWSAPRAGLRGRLMSRIPAIQQARLRLLAQAITQTA